jgi:hypothetical protein
LPFGYQETKCKVLEIISKDLEGNRCEMMASMCLCMLTGVVIQNTTTQPPKLTLMIIEAAQNIFKDNEDVITIPIEEKVANQS